VFACARFGCAGIRDFNVHLEQCGNGFGVASLRCQVQRLGACADAALHLGAVVDQSLHHVCVAPCAEV
jgi:hypothetical protein